MSQDARPSNVIPFPGPRWAQAAPGTRSSGTSLGDHIEQVAGATRMAQQNVTQCEAHLRAMTHEAETWVGLADEVRAASAQMRAAIDALSRLPGVAQQLARLAGR